MIELFKQIISTSLIPFCAGCTLMLCVRFMSRRKYKASNEMKKDLLESYEFMLKRRRN
jgi:uncharacterized pyridoxamine 5'-phosphate oxidase family protein